MRRPVNWQAVLEVLPRLRSLRLRVFLTAVLVTLSPLALVTLSNWQERDVGQRIQANLETVADASVRALNRHDGDIQEIATTLHVLATRHVVRLRLLDQQGNVVVDADHEQGSGLFQALGAVFYGPDGAPSLRQFDSQLAPLHEREEVRRAWVGQPNIGCIHSSGATLLVCHAAVADARGRLVIHAQESTRRAIRALHDVRYQLAKLTLFALPVALLLAWWLGWRMVRPLEKLRQQARGMVAGSVPGKQLTLPRRDEFGDLAESLNTLLGALEERRRSNAVFVADLAHEFKNPVAAIRVCAETLEAGTVDSTRAARLAKVLKDSSARLDALLTQFLDLARAEAGMPNEVRGDLDLAQLVRGVTESIRLQHPDASVQFAVEAPPQALVHGVSGRLESAIRNLIDNGASFAGEGGWVRVNLSTREDRVYLSVSDSGPGIAEADLLRVFDRFYTTRGERRGTGLGLALVKAVVEAHGGSVSVQSPPGQGAVFQMALPMRS